MQELQEFFLLREGRGNWLQVTKSYESESLIHAGKELCKKNPSLNFGVADNQGAFLWKGKGTPYEVPSTDE